MDDPLFAILDDIAQTAKGGTSGHNDASSNRFGDQQLLDHESQYYASQQPVQRLHRDHDFLDQRRDGSRYAEEDEYRHPQGEQTRCRMFLRPRCDTDIMEKRASTFKALTLHLV